MRKEKVNKFSFSSDKKLEAVKDGYGEAGNLHDEKLKDFWWYNKLKSCLKESIKNNNKEVNLQQLEIIRNLQKEEEIKKKYSYKKESKFFDILYDKEASDDIGVKIILKTPLLSTEKGHKISVIRDSYENKAADYYEGGKMIYPSKKETGFGWEIGEELPSSNLPLRLCYVSNEKIEIKKRVECINAKHYAILSYS